MPRRAPAVVSRRTMLTGLAVGGGMAAGYVISGAFEDSPDSRRETLAEDTPLRRQYSPPEGTVDVPPPRRVFYSEASRSEGQTFGDLYLPASANPALPVVVLVHGGGWEDDLGLAYMENASRDLASFDVAVWNIEYRRVGSGGGWPTTVSDVCDAVDHLAALSAGMRGRLDLASVVVCGHSAGGHLALYVAGRSALPPELPGSRPAVPVSGCVSLAGVSDLELAERAGDRYVPGLLGGRPNEKPERYRQASPISHLPTGVPVLCSHGADDPVVLPEQSERYVAAAVRAGDRARLEIVPGQHDPWGDIKGSAWQGVRTEILRMLGRS